jgi:hypothetical protein
MSEYRGECLCGEVRFCARGPTLFCAHCHCRFCRHAHGAGVVTWFGVTESQFEIEAGENALKWYQSSQQSRRGFCSSCGTTMFFMSSVCPGEVHIALACMSDAVDQEPKAHVFYDHHVEWLKTADDLPRLGSNAEVLAKYRDIEKEG